jgi:DNA primase
MKYPKEYLDEIKSRLKVSTVVSRSVNLKKRGKEFIGISPFTNEKTPSFTVNDQKGFYHCFSSHEHGNIFDFLMKTANMKFGEAVRTLAADAGLPIYKFSKLDEEREKKWQVYSKILEKYKSYYHNELKNKKSEELKSYLGKRGLTNKEIDYFQIGFVPKEAVFFDNLKDNFSESDILDSGLFYFDEKNKKYVERFRDRLIFPINGLTGSTIAFGGRIISNQKMAKYINSPETLFFKKGNSLFNLDRTRYSSANHDEVFLVEGYMDVITLTKYGILNTIANLGTALTEKQIETAWRFFNHIIICFDGDQGGVNAAIRAADRLLSIIKPDFKISFLFLPENKDPDNFITEKGKNYFLTYANKKISIYNLIWNHYYRDIDTNQPSSLAQLDKILKNQSNKIKDETVRKYTKEFFLNKLNQLTPLTNKKQKINFRLYREAQPLSSTKEIFFKKKNYKEVELKEFSILYLIINNLNVFERKIELLSEVKLYTEICVEFLSKIIDFLTSNKIYETNTFKEKFKQTKYLNLIDNINVFAPVKFIIEAKKDDNEMLLIFEEINNDLKKFELNQKIDNLEKKMIKDMNEETYKKLLDLKRLANNG